MKKLLKVVLILIAVLVLAAGILFTFDKLFHTNSFENIRTAITSFFQRDQSSEEVQTDTTPISYTLRTQAASILEPTTAVTITSNKELHIDDSAKTNLVLVKHDQDGENGINKYWYALEIKNIGIGTAAVNVSLKDNSNNVEKFTITIKRDAFSLPFGMTAIQPWPNSAYTADGDNLKAQVNKEHKLINDYAPTDLKNLNLDYLLYTNTASITLRKEAADYLNLMLKDLKKDTGKNVVIASGYRSYNEQYRLYAGYVRDLGQEETDKVSARPGFSEHQLGTVVDFIDQDSGLSLTDDFVNHPAGKWISENSYKYGYIQSYPHGKEETTGYTYEAWHYRYIGIDNATAVHTSGLTLKEWLEKNS